MIRTKLLTLNNIPKELSFTDEVDSHYTIVISNNSANKHALIGTENISINNYGIRLEHDSQQLILENISFKDRLYGISEDPTANVPVSVMVIERN